MVDNIDERTTIPYALSFIVSSGENQMAAGGTEGIIAFDQYKSSSPVVPLISNDVKLPIYSLRQIYKNCFVLSLTFVLMFTAYGGIGILQSSLNVEHNVGVNSLIISSVFFIVRATLVGLAAGPLWTAKATYLNQIARYHAQHKCQTDEASISLFFGIFFAFFGTNSIWGNLTSYFVLHQSSSSQKVNCGVNFNPRSAPPTNTTEYVNETSRYILCGTFAGMGVLSIVILFLTLDQVRITKRQPIRESLKKSIEVVVSFTRWKHLEQLFFIPMIMWETIESAFLTAQFTRAFITCLVGIRYVGLVMICSGISQTLSSYLFGRLVKYVGRNVCFSTASLLNYGTIILMFLWQPKDTQIVLLFVIAGIWGIADGVWQTQIVGMHLY
ncbi:unnamed protein product [Rotaria sp. Silwood1]|nr:unnamed protein product [Rotaria sp. Silwood1]CAF3893065.1 unnamed protein product [Rotaria sp. Silwood1]CAF4932290.1 unnamed protein product [Rotaria sp. Silwood1]CAF5001173.1 unnamed protein product [Rotaria sp. Silwood1]